MTIKRKVSWLALLLCGTLWCGAAAAGAETANPWANSPGSKEFPKASAIILKDDIQAVVNADGTSDLVEYDAIKILDKAGLERFAKTTRLYDSKVQTAEVKLARLWSPDGKMIDLPYSQITDTVPDTFDKHPLYARMRQITIDYPNATEGSIVEFRIVHHRKTPWPGNKFWDVSYTQDYEPILDTQFTFTCPDRFGYEISCPGTANLQPEQVSRESGRATTRWHLKDRAAVLKEPAMPPLRQIASQIQISSFSGWNDFGQWSKKMWDQAATSDQLINSKAASVIVGSVSDVDKARALMAYLGKEKPLVGGDLALEDMPPATASEAFGASSLMPQDRAVLLLAMLRACSVKAYPVLASTADYGSADRGVPSLQQFNRVLIVLADANGTLTWIDPSADSPSILGQGLDAQSALILDGQAARLTTTPVESPQANREEVQGVGRLDSDGSMETVLKIREFGANEVVWRSMVSSTKKDEQQRVFEYLVRGINPTASLRDYYIAPLDAKNPDGPMTVTISFETSHATGRAPGEAVSMPLPILMPRRLVAYAETPVADRLYPVALGSTTYEEKRIELVVPAVWQIKALPHSVSKTNAIGSFQLEAHQQGRNVYYFSRLIIRRSEIPLAEYGLFKDLLTQVGASSDETITLVGPPSPAQVPKS